ncbi:MAG: helix-turn-helix domain-containing protein [Candidatus Poribacteria bacterium]|nr:helix-turn-helix domain-containing protein [Candidatus Poribacteria bacterium]
MRIRHAVVEYDLEEAAAMLDISPADLKQAVSAGYLQCYYRLGEGDYRFHEASLRANKDLLSEDDYLAKVLKAGSHSETTTVPDAAEEDLPPTPSDP